MSDQKISALTAATTPLAGTEVLPIVQSSTTKKVSVDNLTVGKTVQMDKLLTGSGDSNAGANFCKYGSAWNASASTYPYPAGNTFAVFNYGIPAQENWFGFIGGYGTSSGSVNILLQQNLNNTSQQAGSFIGSEATSATAADIIMGKMVAGATTSANSTKTVQARLKPSGDFQLADGNFIPSTAAKGVNFTANTPAAGMTSQLLNWYEEGTWTPTATSQTGSITTYASGGTYTRVGRQVTVTAYVDLTTVGTAGGLLVISNFPYKNGAASGAGYLQQSGIVRESGVTGANYACFISGNSTTGYIQALTGGAITWTNSYQYALSITYYTA